MTRHAVRRAAPVGALLTLALLLAACRGGETAARDPAPTPTPSLSVAPLTPESVLRPEVAALALIPADAETATITDLDAIRARLGVPDLTSDDLMSDRRDFWDRAERESVLLTDGLLREDSSEPWLDYGFTEDDVDWEARFTGPAGAGYVVAFRPDQEMADVARAVDAGVGPLGRGTVLADLHLLVSGIADEGASVWASDPGIVALFPGATGPPPESTYVRRGCIPFAEALGADAGVEDQDAVLAAHDPTDLDPLAALAVSFVGDVATAWLAPGRDDLFDRADLIDGWPTTGSIGFADGFTGAPVVDPGTGRIGLHVANPVAAANLTLTDLLPFGICNEVTPLDEPTGL